MCGIVGILNRDGDPVSAAVLGRMVRTLEHRGPDGEGVYASGAAGLGHRRLAILDLSSAGHQPMAAAGGTGVITHSGEIYNFRELRARLQSLGHRFHSETDTEVVLNAYLEWGAACVAHLNGMFAFAIWDEARQELFLARDRYGIKPLYYVDTQRCFLFASEIKALLRHPDVRAAVDDHALQEYFTFQNVFSDRTLFRGVRMFPAGCVGTVRPGRAGGLELARYWDYDFVEPAAPASMEEYEEELDRLFRQAVRRQLVSDVPVGAYLSGGMDSGAITAVASRDLDHLPTFTGGFDLSSASGLELQFDERQRAEELSYLFGTRQYEVVMKAGDMERVLRRLVWHLEDLRVGQSYPNYYVAELASKFVKVVLAGTGGDELFAGYPWRYYRAAGSNGAGDFFDRYYAYWQRLVPTDVMGRLFAPRVRRALAGVGPEAVFRGVMDGIPGDAATPQEYVNLSLHFEARTFLHGLLVVEDKLSMAHGVETRVPFLDNDLVDFAMDLPVSAKLRNLGMAPKLDENHPGSKRDLYFHETHDGKLLLRNTLARYLPDAYAIGPKQGFSGPDASWFRGESIEYVRTLLLVRDARLFDYLDRATVHELVGDHLERGVNRRLLIWSLLCFEHWLQLFVEG